MTRSKPATSRKNVTTTPWNPWNRRLTPAERKRYERKRYAVLRQPGETKAAHLKRTHFRPSDRGGIPCGEWFCYSEGADGLLLAIVSRELSRSGSWSGGLLESEAIKRAKRVLKTEHFYVVPGDKCEHPQPWRVRHLLVD